MVRILQLTDLHLFADPEAELLGCRTRENFLAVWRHVAELDPPPRLLVLTGDIAHDDSLEVYRWLSGLINERGWPAAWIPGNHDHPQRMAEGFEGMISAEKELELDGWRLLLVDSQQVGQVEGRVGSTQLEWLRVRLQEADAAGRHVLVALHHPPFAVDSTWLDALGLENRDELWEVLDAAPALRVVLCGHVHQEVDQQRGAVRLLATPACAMQFAPHTEEATVDDRPPGYRILDLQPDGAIESRVVRV